MSKLVVKEIDGLIDPEIVELPIGVPGKHIHDVFDGGFDVPIKPSDVITKGPMVDARAYGTSGTLEAINAAIADIDTDEKTLYLAPGTWTLPVSGNITIPTNVNLKIERGAILDMAAYSSVIVDGTLEAGPYKIFNYSDATPTVTFGESSIVQAYGEWWGAMGDDSTDCAAAFNAAFAAFNVIKSLYGIYRVYAPLYFLSQESRATFVWQGIGDKTKIDFYDFSSGEYCVKVNETVGGGVHEIWAGWPHVYISDIRFRGDNSTEPNFLKQRNTGITLERVRLQGFNDGVVTGQEYVDTNRFTQVTFSSPYSGYFYKQFGFGDNTVLDQIRTSNQDQTEPYYHMDVGLAHIETTDQLGTGNLTIRNCNAGRIYLKGARGVVIENWHCENVAPGDRSLTAIDSQFILRDSYIWNNIDGATEPVLIQASSSAFHGDLENNRFVTYMRDDEDIYTGAAALGDIKIVADADYRDGRLRLVNNKRVCSYAISSSLQALYGIKVTTPDDVPLVPPRTPTAPEVAISAAVATHTRLLSGEVQIVSYNTALATASTVYKVLPINNDKITHPYMTTVASIGSLIKIQKDDPLYEAYDYDSNLPAGTYYYKVAYLVNGSSFGQHTAASAETTGITTTSAAAVINFQLIGAVPQVIARVWRRASPSTDYDRYVDIPLVEDMTYVWDCGWHLSGFPWLTYPSVNIPQPPTVNTCLEGIEFVNNRRMYWYSVLPTTGEWGAGHGDDFININPGVDGIDGYRTVNATFNTMKSTATSGATTIEINDTDTIEVGDKIGITLDNMAIHSTTVGEITSEYLLVIDNAIPAYRTAPINNIVRTYRHRAKASLA